MLSGCNAVITGADRGLGKAIAKEFLEQGASICICSRREDALKQAVFELREAKKNNVQKILYWKTDISRKDELDALYGFAVRELHQLDIVVNNAGIYGPIGPTDQVEWDGMEQVVRVNLMGTLYSMRKAVEIFKKQGCGGRIVNLSGGGASKGMPNFMGYAITKTAVVRATETMALEVEKDGIRINAVAPGALNTQMLEEALNAGEAAVGKLIYQKMLQQKASGGASLEYAASLVAYLSSGAADGINGKLISAVWDDWECEGFSNKETTRDPDMYTLRRMA